MLLDDGEVQTLEDILESRRWRQERQEALMHDFPDSCVVSVKMNIPGSVKTNDGIRSMYWFGARELCSQFSSQWLDVIESHWYAMRATGPEGFLVVDGGSLAVKTCTIEFEDKCPIGRLFDVDVMTDVSDHQISRKSLGLEPRTCFVCDLPAKDCARSRKHSAEQMGEAVNRYYEAYRSLLGEKLHA